MSDPSGFPGRHTTTTSVSQTTVQPQLRWDPTYIRTRTGILKLAVILLNLLGFICIMASGNVGYLSHGRYFSTVSSIGFWFSLILLFCYLLHICEKFYKIPWLKVEMFYCLIWAILYVFAASFAATIYSDAFYAAAFFGYCAMVIYGFDAFVKYKAVQNGEIAQGSRVVQQQQTSVTIS